MNRLWVRLTVGFLSIVLLLLAMVTLAINVSVTDSFRQYVTEMDMANFGVATIDDLTNYYRAHSTWEGAEPLLPVAGNGPGGRSGRGPQSFVAGANGIIVAATNGSWIGQAANTVGAARTTPLTVDGVLVGMLGQQSPGGQRMAQAGHRFAEQINAALLGVGAVAALLALGAGIFLSYTLARPLQRLAERIRPLTLSHIGEQVPVEGPTEVRELATEFNGLSQRLSASEKQRQQMSSDIAHELRTPVTVLRGHLEAMMDGVYPLDAEHLAVAYDQTIHLARLVEDLRLLTQAEAGRLELNPRPCAISALVEPAVARFAPLAQDAEVAVTYAAAPGLPPVCVDDGRMQQVFDNLLANALRHTPTGGEISIYASAHGKYVEVVLANPGELAPDELEHLFDRFWRAASARRRDAGGSGLGLAITRQLVVLQHGEIRAEENNGIISFVLDLPAAI
jgi:two-component system OmpR family sensor kinase/two-component system sensor histidine kinase BaeS